MYKSIKSIGLVVLLLCFNATYSAACTVQGTTQLAESDSRGAIQTTGDSDESKGVKGEFSQAYMKYTEGLFKAFDRDRDGFLDKSELEKMRKPPVNADLDGDGKISKDEMVEAVQNKPKNSDKLARSGSAKPNVKKSNVVGGEIKVMPVVEANLYLLQFDESASTREQFDEFFEGIKQPRRTIQSVLTSASHRSDLVNIEELRCQLVEGRAVETSGRNLHSGTNLQLSAKLIAVDPKVRCQVEVDKRYLANKLNDVRPDEGSSVGTSDNRRVNLQKEILARIEAKRNGERPDGDHLTSTSDKKHDELEQMILARIEAKKKELKKERKQAEKDASHTTDILKALQVSTTFVCELGEFQSMSVTSGGGRWILIAEFK